MPVAIESFHDRARGDPIYCSLGYLFDSDSRAMQKHEAIQGKVRGDTQLPFQVGSFHLVAANVVVEQVEDPHALLTEIHRVLGPEGVLLFDTPNLLKFGWQQPQCKEGKDVRI